MIDEFLAKLAADGDLGIAWKRRRPRRCCSTATATRRR